MRQSRGRRGGGGPLVHWCVPYVERLEDRRLLDATVQPSPWQNPTLPLDVNHDGATSAIDALEVIHYLTTNGAGPVPSSGPTPPDLYLDVNGDGFVSPVDALLIINRLTAPPPTVTIAALTPITADRTPQLTVTVSHATPLAAGLQVKVDVDLNNDNFSGPGETDYAQATLFNGSATFDLAPALPFSPQGSSYQVKIRAHVQDGAGIVGYSPVLPLTVNTNVSSALATYVQAPDPTYGYQLKNTTPDPTGNHLYTIYDVSMTSQTWRTTQDVNQPVWQHWVRIFVPNAQLTGPVSSTAVLLIDGGSYSNTLPSVDPSTNSNITTYGIAAARLHAVLIDLEDVPNEPLVFTGDPGNQRSEDAIIAYTFNQFMNHLGQSGNDTWPALLPMVKSAVRAMDTAQSFLPTSTSAVTINNFLVTGYSKRGWTTWLTAAVDPRVIAIVPGVFDNLNQGEQMVHQYGVYASIPPNPTLIDGFSIAVQDYASFGIIQNSLTPQSELMGQITDPYSYLHNGRFDNMPKLLINSAGDEFFLPDSAQFYFHDIPGTQNYLRYIPNVGHGLDQSDPVNSTISFYQAVVNNYPLPKFSWVITPDGSIRVKATDAPTQVLLWQATNPVDRDFRHLFNPGIVWTSSVLADQGGGVYIGSAPMPATGATAFFVQLTFPSGVPNDPFVFTTEIHVNSLLPLVPWAFPTGVLGLSAAASAASAALATLAPISPAAASLGPPIPLVLATPAPLPAPPDAEAVNAPAAILPQKAALTTADSAIDSPQWSADADNAELVDCAFGSGLDAGSEWT